MIKEEKCGITYYFGADPLACCDMDINPGLTTVQIWHNINMSDTDKVFPDVKELEIMRNVKDIQIPNSLFPNVKNINSNSPAFPTSRYLISRCGVNNHLLNVFSVEKDECIYIPYVYKISDYAFASCKSTNLFTKYPIVCQKDAFTDSAFLEQPYVNGVKMAGSIVAAIDYDADVVIFPDEKEPVSGFAYGIDLGKVKKLVIHNISSISYVHMNENLPKNVELVIDEPHEEYDIQYLVHSSGANGVIENFSITLPYYKTVDGITYSADMKRVVVGNMMLNDVIILEGVEEILSGAFENTEIKSVKLPDSLKILGSEVFHHCLELHSVDFGNGITVIEEGAFRGCEKLEHVELPQQLISIQSSAFKNTGLKDIKLNNGLKEIGMSALSACGLEEIVMPASLKSVTAPFSRTIKHVTSEKYSNVLIEAISPAVQLKPNAEHDYTIKVIIAGKTAYLPRFVDDNLRDEFLRKTKAFFTRKWPEHCEFWSYAYSARGKDDAALAEYLAYGAEKAKKYLKKNSKKIITQLIEDKNEELAAAFLKTGLVSTQTLKILLPIAEEKEMLVIKSYILEEIGERKRNNEQFSI